MKIYQCRKNLAGRIKNTVVLIFWHIQCLHLMNSEVTWVLLVSLGTRVQPQIILDPDFLLNYLSISYDYGTNENGLGRRTRS